MTIDPNHPRPEAGGVYMRDPVTGALTPADTETPPLAEDLTETPAPVEAPVKKKDRSDA